jgi:hypothetical protein
MKYNEKTLEAGQRAFDRARHLGNKIAAWRRRNAMMALEPDMRTPNEKKQALRKAIRAAVAV